MNIGTSSSQIFVRIGTFATRPVVEIRPAIFAKINEEVSEEWVSLVVLKSYGGSCIPSPLGGWGGGCGGDVFAQV